MATQTRPRWTFEDYFAWEALQPTRHEFVDGEVYAITGGTPRHSRVIVRATAALYPALRGTGCELFDGNLKLRVEASGNSYYPDLLVVCGVQAVEERGVATDATVVIEVLSPGTASYNRRAKFADYRRLPSLAHYVLIDPNAFVVECFSRDGGDWRYADLTDAPTLPLPAIGVTLTIADLFEGLGDPLPPVNGPPPGRVDPHAA